MLLSLALACGSPREAPPTPPDERPAELPPAPTNDERPSPTPEQPPSTGVTPEVPPTEDAPPEETPPENVATLDGGTCELGPPVAIGTSPTRRTGVAVMLDERGGFAAFSSGESAVTLVPLGPDGLRAGPDRPLELHGAMDLKGLFAVGGDVVIVAHALCPDGRYHQKCLFARAFARDGANVGPELEHRTIEWANIDARATADSLDVLRTHTYLPTVLERYRVGEGRAITREELLDLGHGFTERGASEPPHGIAFATDGARAAALVALSDELYLHVTGRDHATVTGVLPETVRSIAFDGDALRLVTTRRGDVALTELALDGTTGETETASPTPVAPFTARVHREREGAPAMFERTDALGRRIGDPVRLGPLRAVAVGGTENRFVALLAPEGPTPRTVELHPISCP
jgi:hypothetical protein